MMWVLRTDRGALGLEDGGGKSVCLGREIYMETIATLDNLCCVEFCQKKLWIITTYSSRKCVYESAFIYLRLTWRLRYVRDKGCCSCKNR